MTRKRAHKGNRKRGGGGGSSRPEMLVGTLRVSRPGVASVETAEGSFRVTRRGIHEAMNGDEVQVYVFPSHGGEKIAAVQSVLKRAVTTFVGTFDVTGPLGVVRPLDTRLGHEFYVVPDDRSAELLGVGIGDVVIASIAEYPTRRSAAIVSIEKRLGSSDELDLNVESVIASNGLVTEFPEPVLAEAEGISADIEQALAEPGRRDLREIPCFTIDPSDARDFDDAVFARRLEGGGFELWVSIADVSHYVRWDSSIDNEAKRRTCSVYLVDRVLPMLPERLCNDVCSLKPNEDRLAMSVRIVLDKTGKVVSSEETSSVIRSVARLAYDEVDDLLEGRIEPSGLSCDSSVAPVVAEAITALDQLRVLRERVRERRGAIDFDTTETKVTLDENGRPTGVRVRRRTRGTGLVEEAMLLANECVATVLADREIPCAYRVHERPSPDDLRATIGPLSELGLIESSKERDALVAGSPDAIRAVLARARGTDGAYLANALLLRAQRRAVYLPTNQGHYALGARAYCHFTSPIRRYPDLLVHRALKALLADKSDSREQAQIARVLPQLCAECSRMERVADNASRESQEVKIAEFYSDKIGQSFSGIVSGCERYGLFVTLDDTCAEGLVPTRELGQEWFSYDEKRLTLTGEETGQVWRPGRRIAVTVTGTDPARGRIDFALAGPHPMHHDTQG